MLVAQPVSRPQGLGRGANIKVSSYFKHLGWTLTSEKGQKRSSVESSGPASEDCMPGKQAHERRSGLVKVSTPYEVKLEVSYRLREKVVPDDSARPVAAEFAKIRVHKHPCTCKRALAFACNCSSLQERHSCHSSIRKLGSSECALKVVRR